MFLATLEELRASFAAVHLDDSIALGSMIHLVILLVAMVLFYRMLNKKIAAIRKELQEMHKDVLHHLRTDNSGQTECTSNGP